MLLRGPLPSQSAVKQLRKSFFGHLEKSTVKPERKAKLCILRGRTLHTCSSVGPFFKTFFMQNAYFSNTCPKYGGAWPFHSGIIMVAWWRPLGGLWGLWGSIWAEILKSSWRRPLGGLLGPLGGILGPLGAFLTPESCSTRVHPVAN